MELRTALMLVLSQLAAQIVLARQDLMWALNDAYWVLLAVDQGKSADFDGAAKAASSIGHNLDAFLRLMEPGTAREKRRAVARSRRSGRMRPHSPRRRRLSVPRRPRCRKARCAAPRTPTIRPSRRSLPLVRRAMSSGLPEAVASGSP
jgi:hypothetical protein